MLGQILVLWIRDHLPLELEVARKEVYRGFEAEVSLREGNDAGESGDGVGGEVMNLESELVEEAPEEITNGQSEAALEVRDEDHPFPFLDLRLEFALWQATLYPGGNPPSRPEPLDFVRSYIRTFPAGSFSDLQFEVWNLGLFRSLRRRHLGRINLQRMHRSLAKEKGNLESSTIFG